MNAVLARTLVAQLIVELRGERSRAFLRGLAAGVRAFLDETSASCPYLDATAEADAFYFGVEESLRVVEEPRKPSNSARQSKRRDRAVAVRRPPPERSMKLWEPDEVEALAFAYMSGAKVADFAACVERTPNAVAWKLWTVAATNDALKERLFENHDAKPARGADLRLDKRAFDWVLVHLRAACNQCLHEGKDVALDILLSKAEGALSDWPPSFGGDEAVRIERAAAFWLFDHPELWWLPMTPPEEGFQAEATQDPQPSTSAV